MDDDDEALERLRPKRRFIGHPIVPITLIVAVLFCAWYFGIGQSSTSDTFTEVPSDNISAISNFGIGDASGVISLYSYNGTTPVIQMDSYTVLSNCVFDILQLGDTPVVAVTENATHVRIENNLFRSWKLEPGDILVFKRIDRDGQYFYGFEVVREE